MKDIENDQVYVKPLIKDYEYDIGKENLEDELSVARAALGFLMEHDDPSPLSTSVVLRGVRFLLDHVLAMLNADGPLRAFAGVPEPRLVLRWTEPNPLDEAFAEADRLGSDAAER